MKILIVEDDDDLRMEIAEYLRRRRHELVACASLAAARDALSVMLERSEAPQAALCDIGLPDGDGADLYVGFAPRLPGCQWILMSGGHDLERLESIGRSKELPPPLIVDKPVSLRVLNQHLEAYVNAGDGKGA